MNRKFSFLAFSVTSGFISFYGYDDWKVKELRRLHFLSEELAREGFLKLRMDNYSNQVRNKKLSWDMLLKPRMLKHWESKYDGFDCSKEVGGWPEPKNGKNYSMTLRDQQVPGMPKVFSSHYLSQAILCYFIDPQMRLVHFGDKQTSFKLKLLIDPVWAFTSLLPHESMISRPNGMFEFRGDDQSWHITSLPNRAHGGRGKAIAWNSHFDAGQKNVFHKGIPPTVSGPERGESEGDDDAGTTAALSARERGLLLMALHQLAVMFYCDTPGDLTAARGATGFYPRSHVVVHEALGKLLEDKDGEGRNKQLLWGAVGFALREVFRSPIAVSYNAKNSFDSQIKVGDLVQPELAEDEVLLALGTLVHTAMYSTELMPNKNPRVIQNLKVSAKPSLLAKGGEELLCRISRESFLFRTFTAPLSLSSANGPAPETERAVRLCKGFISAYESQTLSESQQR